MGDLHLTVVTVIQKQQWDTSLVKQLVWEIPALFSAVTSVVREHHEEEAEKASVYGSSYATKAPVC